MPDETITAEDLAKKKAELEELTAKVIAMGKEVVDTKPLYKSKMLWVNAIAIGIMLAETYYGAGIIDVGTMTVVLGAANIVLRYLGKDITGVLK